MLVGLLSPSPKSKTLPCVLACVCWSKQTVSEGMCLQQPTPSQLPGSSATVSSLPRQVGSQAQGGCADQKQSPASVYKETHDLNSTRVGQLWEGWGEGERCRGGWACGWLGGGGEVGRVVVGMRGKFILANSEPEQWSVPATTFSSGEAKVSHSSSTWTCLPWAPASFA